MTPPIICKAHALLEDPVGRAQAALVLGRTLLLSHPDDADAVFSQALDELGGVEAELGRLLEGGLIVNALREPHLQRRLVDRLSASGPDRP